MQVDIQRRPFVDERIVDTDSGKVKDDVRCDGANGLRHLVEIPYIARAALCVSRQRCDQSGRVVLTNDDGDAGQRCHQTASQALPQEPGAAGDEYPPILPGFLVREARCATMGAHWLCSEFLRFMR